MADDILVASGVRKVYRTGSVEVDALRGVDLRVSAGEFVAVRERRRQIGMLRSLGFQAGKVRAMFLLESGFVALEGMLIGTTLAIITSYQIVANSDFFGASGFRRRPVAAARGPARRRAGGLAAGKRGPGPPGSEDQAGRRAAHRRLTPPSRFSLLCADGAWPLQGKSA